MSRYTRDEIISQGLELAASPTVLQHDMPGGVVDPSAYGIKWLQNALDTFHRRYPFSADVTSVAVTLQANSADVLVSAPSTYLPSDFIVDMRNGLIAQISATQQLRMRRIGMQRWLDMSVSLQNTQGSSVGQFGYYTVANNRMKIAPLIQQSQAATLWYYALPAAMTAVTQPNFPDEWTLIEFIRLKALEFTRSIDPGMAQEFFQKQLAVLRSSGLLNEAEYDAVPLENNQVVLEGYPASYNWMGPPIGST